VILSVHPAAPDRPYLSWQRKVRIQLETLRVISHPDSRTRAEIDRLKGMLSRVKDNLQMREKKCSSKTCTNVFSDSRFRQCLSCRESKAAYMRRVRGIKKWPTRRRPKSLDDTN
jgi:hypothetical protein